MNQEIRNKLRNVVTQCRKLLEGSVSEELEGKYGIFAKKDQITADPNAKMPHLTGEEQASRRDILDHFGHVKARGFKPKEALDQLVREIAFTHLNRLCAYKMMEAREVYVGGHKFREAISRGVNSNGVKFYLADHAEDERLFNTGHQDIAYRHFLDWLGGLLSEEIGVLFNPNDPANRLYPRQTTLNEVLELLNGGGIKPEEKELREAWPNIWSQDETLGWVYQYFTPKELREQARKENPTPQNSYELAFRNQFFTPRYVVEFLTDNTLGRIWYEMRKGATKLNVQCRYMVRRPTEIFLKEGEQLPKDAANEGKELSQEELLKLPVYIPHRPKKDPRELKILDPACGSGHFLLYCFDLMQTIYEEAYSDADLGPVLHKQYKTLEELRLHVPQLILAHNLYGIDIDLRASQIAALALWLRCQRAYQEMGLKKERLKITRSNFVCAEPMPGEGQMLKDFVAQLEPKLLGQVVEVVFKKMSLAGEAGPLLKIEEEIREVVASAKKQWIRETTQATDRKGQPLLFTQAAMDRIAGKPEQSSIFDLTDITDDQFFDVAEAQVVEALGKYAPKAQNGQRFQRTLFTDDAERGFAFVDLCHKRYDVVLMNPPFGEASSALEDLLAEAYADWNNNLLCAFIDRAYQLSSPVGMVGVIFDRTAIVKSTYEDFRRAELIRDSRLHYLADLGWGVLDANVEVTTAVISHRPSKYGLFLDARNTATDAKGEWIATQVTALPNGDRKDTIIADSSGFATLPNAVIGYDFPDFLRTAFRRYRSLEDNGYRAYQGHALKSERHFRVWWELPPTKPHGFSSRLFNGAGYAPYYSPLYECVVAATSLDKLPKDSATVLRNKSCQGLRGICFGKRGEFFCAHVLPSDHVFTVEGQAIPLADENHCFDVLGYLNTPLVRLSLNRYCGQHKYSGYVNLLPYPQLPNAKAVRAGVRRAIESQMAAGAFDETQSHFSSLSHMHSLVDYTNEIRKALAAGQTAVTETEALCNEAAVSCLKVSGSELAELDSFRSRQPTPSFAIVDISNLEDVAWFSVHSTISQAVGIVFGRWDVRLAVKKAPPPALPNPFAALPKCSPAMLRKDDATPLEVTPEEYPIGINWAGILVDDEEHHDDVVRRVREVFEAVWKDGADVIENEACEMASVKDLREYFRTTGKGGFWDDHVFRYSKSRRKAPIYWILQSSNKNYALWFYYHRLNKDLLFKALLKYVEPKIRLETSRLEGLRKQRAIAADSAKEGKRLANEVERQDDFLSELQDFEDKLRRAANLHLEPDLIDGVMLNIAPLHELVPWKEAKEYWEELLAGKYEWSSVGKQLRQKGLVK
jgi:hypothetical protein